MNVLYCYQSSVRFWLTRGKTVLETWGKGLDVIPFLNLKGYYGGTKAVMELFDEISIHQSNYDWYVFSDEDIYIWISRFEKELKMMDATKPSCFCYVYDFCTDPNNKNTICTGHHIDMPVKFPSGCCFAITKVAFERILSYLHNDSDPAYSMIGDVAFGLWMRATGIELIHDPRFDIEGQKLDENNLETNLMSHRLSSSKIKELHFKFGGEGKL